MPHNVEIKDAGGAALFLGEIFPGVADQVYDVPALAAGQLSVRVHGPSEHDGDAERAVAADAPTGPPTTHRLAVSVLVLIVAASALVGCQAQPRVVKVGEPAPPLTGTTLDGTPFDLASLRGRPVVVNFWASWCGPCRDEFPLFQAQLEQESAPASSSWACSTRTIPTLARDFAAEFGMTWPSVIDPSGGGRDGVPRRRARRRRYFIDREGIVRSIQIGEVARGRLRAPARRDPAEASVRGSRERPENQEPRLRAGVDEWRWLRGGDSNP